jgi:serine O-acetyltransferase
MQDPGVDTLPPVRSRVVRAWRKLIGAPHTDATELLWRDVRARHPRFTAAVVADARVTAARRGDRHEFTSRLDAATQAVRLALVTDAFFALCCYRAKAHCQALGIPFLPRLLHRLAVVTGQISIGDPVVVHPGLYVPHGQVVIDGMVEIGERVELSPFVTIGLRTGSVLGPTIGSRASIGTGAKLLGPIRVGSGARIGANAVVLCDVPDGATVVGVPGRVRS